MLRPRPGCAGCAGTCLWRRAALLRVPRPPDTGGIASGDRVEIVLPERFALYAALVAYGLPLAGILVGAALAAWLDSRDGAVLAGALAGCMAAFTSTRVLRQRLERAVLARCTISRVGAP